MSLAELRKELKDLRKNAMPTPVSRMKKTECVREIERLRILHGKEERATEKMHKEEEVAVKKAMKDAPKSVEKAVEKAQTSAHKKEQKVEKKMHKKEEEHTHTPSKFIKGSAEAKERMAKLREMRGKKKD
jgi:cation transport ATPase